MAKIEGFRVKNYKVLKDITIGKLWNNKKKELTAMTAVIGKNGVGKSTLFDAFGFLADCLKLGVEEACDSRKRGGFNRIRSQGQEGSIEFEIYYKEEKKSLPITYQLEIDLDSYERPYVKSEILRQRRKGQRRGQPFCFLILKEGKGVAWKGEALGISEEEQKLDLLSYLNQIEQEQPEQEEQQESRERELVELNDKRKLGIVTLGALKQHPRISVFREFIESWYLSYFTPDAARSLPLAGPQKHLNIHGDNLGNVVQFMEREHRKKFQSILDKIAKKIPGVHEISTEKSQDNRLLLKFNDRGFKDPFFVQQMSDGTLKVFAYLLLLEDPEPPPFLCIEEPENGLYHKLLETLVDEFRKHAKQGESQIFVTTHQPYFVDGLNPEEVWILEKQPDGFSTIKRASENPLIKNLVAEDLPLGGLWYSDYFDER